MNGFLSKIKNSGFVNDLRAMLYSKYFPFVTAAVAILCYYLGLDIVFIYYISITGVLMLLLLDDLIPLVSHLLFMSVAVSYENSPSTIMEKSDYFFRTEIFVQTVILLTLFALAAVYRVVVLGVKKNFRLTPTFFGLCAFGFVLLLNGLFSENSSADNFAYGVIMALCFLFPFVGLKDNIKTDRDGFEKLALSFVALSLLLVTELTVKYLTMEGLIENGIIHREKLVFGWGMWNTMGMMIVLCIPMVVYLAGRKKYGFVYTAYSALLFVAAFMSCSRQAIIAVAVIYPVCVIILLIKGKHRIANICILVAAAVAGAIMIVYTRDTVAKYFIELMKKLFTDGQATGNGRMKLWKEAIQNFLSAKFLGVGFYYDFSGDPGFAGLGFIPLMCHNTVCELLSACGILGLAAYAVHRVQTIISFFKHITVERFFTVLTIAGLLITSLFDNHIFYIFPTLIYSGLLAVLIKSEKYGR